jgi:hypothetical protein
VLISLAGGAAGLLGSVALLRELSVWRPIPIYPIHLPVNPDGKVYLVALLLALASGFLSGAAPVRQILRTTPYEVIKAGSTGMLAGNTGKRITVRDVLLVVAKSAGINRHIVGDERAPQERRSDSILASERFVALHETRGRGDLD